MNSKETTVAIIGAGARGRGFAGTVTGFAPLGKVVAVAEPREVQRREMAETHGIPAGSVFQDWQSFCEQPKCCDAVVIATMDQEHAGPAIACMRKGYHVLLEKPMATTLEDCRAIAAAAEEAGVITSVCHSLRYNKGFAKLKDIVASGRLGRLITVDHLEQVAWWHQAHSFVRGNWGNEARSSFMLLSKSCHDLDYMSYLIGAPCRTVSSFGGLTYFTREHAPAGSGERCVDCAVEPDCAYSAIRHYVRKRTFPAHVTTVRTDEGMLEAIRTGPYGRCVWKTDNDVVDHQVVSLQYAGGVTATFTMTGFTQQMGREIRVHGTEAEARFAESRIEIREFDSGDTESITVAPEGGGHGGGDSRVVLSWLRAIRENNRSLVTTDVQESLRTHAVVFAAETARREGRLVLLAD